MKNIEVNILDGDGCFFYPFSIGFQMLAYNYSDFFEKWGNEKENVIKKNEKLMGENLRQIAGSFIKNAKKVDKFFLQDTFPKFIKDKFKAYLIRENKIKENDEDYKEKITELNNFIKDNSDENLASAWCLLLMKWINKINKEFIYELFVMSNYVWIENLKNRENNFDQIILINGSNRQSYAIDKSNSTRNGTPSFFVCLQVLHTYLFKNISSKIQLNTFTLTDTVNGLREGESFNNVLKHVFMDKDGLTHKSCFFDDNKIMLLYNAIHHVAVQNRLDKITINFYDDKKDILNNVYRVFSQYPQLLPKRVTLNLHRYVGKLYPEVMTVKGSGSVDMYYRKNVNKMAAMCGAIDPAKKGKIDVAKQLNFDIFLATRVIPSISNNALIGQKRKLEESNFSVVENPIKRLKLNT